MNAQHADHSDSTTGTHITVEELLADPAAESIVGYVPGGFDMLHIGHLNILRASRKLCTTLIAGVATDESLIRMKNRAPIVPHAERMELVRSLSFVDGVVADHDQDKRVAWKEVHFDVLFKGDDWKDTAKGARLEEELAEVGARVVYLPYTKSTSSTMLRKFLARDIAEYEAESHAVALSGASVARKEA